MKKEKRSLADANPELAAQWHPTRNGLLRPEDVAPNSNRRVWWFLPYDDPTTGHHDFEWESSICNRYRGRGCPYLSNKAVWIGYNDLATINPMLASEWDAAMNGQLTPTSVTCGYDKQVFWRCENGHSWRASVYNRHFNKSGCPHCSKELKTSFPEQIVFYYVQCAFPDAINGDRSTLDGFEIDVYIPSLKIGIEYDGRAWHKNADRDIKKHDLAATKGIKLIHIREDGCPPLPIENATIINKVASRRERDIKEVLNKLFNILGVRVDVNISRDIHAIQSLISFTTKGNSLEQLYPHIANEWDYEKNGNLTPSNVPAYSNKIVWWQLLYTNPKSGANIVFEWLDSVYNRTKLGLGCPYLSGHKILPGFNDLLASNPTLAKEWNYDKNEGLINKKGEDISTPDKVTPGSNQKVWWKCAKGHEWQSTVYKRVVRGDGCPECYKNNRKRKTVDQSELILDPSDPAA